ncbi:MAG: hypothetical protein LBU69_06660 [Deltaproteobacteria bacterium]|jgi:tetratricopeptide (TPR) repeat protein|nr:hypothetical protein [Deltaproteobacteria bacterium]
MAKAIGLAAIVLVALSLAAMAGGCARHPKKILPGAIGLGQFTGPGAEEVKSELARLLSPADRPGRSLVLSGTTDFTLSAKAGQEVVTISNRYDSRWPETLPGWENAPRPNTGYKTAEYPLTQVEATLKADWALTEANSQALVSSGTTNAVLARSYGGFLESQGQAESQPPGRDELARLLAKSLADRLAMSIGPAYPSANLASGKDKQSRKAASLASAGDWDGASEIWLGLLRLNPDYAPALFNMGLYHERQGRLETAWAFYRLAFLRYQSLLFRMALSRTADALEKLGRLPEASPPRPF